MQRAHRERRRQAIGPDFSRRTTRKEIVQTMIVNRKRSAACHRFGSKNELKSPSRELLQLPHKSAATG